jgi:quercetin dioxygenase-like cupin family protein
VVSKEDGCMKLKSALRVVHASEVPSTLGICGEGQPIRVLVGSPDHPSERMIVITKTFAAGTHEVLHWHLIEAFYYVISGRGVLKDIEGKNYPLGPGTIIYAPPGDRRLPRVGSPGAAQAARLPCDR